MINNQMAQLSAVTDLHLVHVQTDIFTILLLYEDTLAA